MDSLKVIHDSQDVRCMEQILRLEFWGGPVLECGRPGGGRERKGGGRGEGEGSGWTVIPTSIYQASLVSQASLGQGAERPANCHQIQQQVS
jgi:hypothetical protein